MAPLADITVQPHRVRPCPPEAVLALYRTEDWWPDRTAAQVATALRSGPAVGAWRGDELVGFSRAVTDGVLRAYLEDVVVHPGLRGVGLGRLLVQHMLEELRDIPVVSLFCAPHLGSFYEACGFAATTQTVLHRSGAG